MALAAKLKLSSNFYLVDHNHKSQPLLQDAISSTVWCVGQTVVLFIGIISLILPLLLLLLLLPIESSIGRKKFLPGRVCVVAQHTPVQTVTGLSLPALPEQQTGVKLVLNYTHTMY